MKATTTAIPITTANKKSMHFIEVSVSSFIQTENEYRYFMIFFGSKYQYNRNKRSCSGSEDASISSIYRLFLAFSVADIRQFNHQPIFSFRSYFLINKSTICTSTQLSARLKDAFDFIELSLSPSLSFSGRLRLCRVPKRRKSPLKRSRRKNNKEIIHWPGKNGSETVFRKSHNTLTDLHFSPFGDLIYYVFIQVFTFDRKRFQWLRMTIRVHWSMCE